MIPLTTLYDDYIDRPKLTEQKNPFEYIVPPPLKWVGTIINDHCVIFPDAQIFKVENLYNLAANIAVNSKKSPLGMIDKPSIFNTLFKTLLLLHQLD